MAKAMLSQEEWGRNVGTESYPVTFLHEYAVGLIWDILHTGSNVSLPTIDGGMAEDIREGVDRVVIPDSLQPIGGYIPDLALYDKDLRVVRVIEVVVTSPPPPEKVAALTKRGVEIIVVPVRNEEELRALLPAPFDGQRPRWERLGRIIGADGAIRMLMKNLLNCSPSMRRELVVLLEEMGSLESLYPLRRGNPKGKDLYGEADSAA